MSGPRDTGVHRQETVLSVFQCSLAFISAFVTSRPNPWQSRYHGFLLCVRRDAPWPLHVHVRKQGGSVGPPAPGVDALPLRLHSESVCTRHRSFVLSKCKSLSDNHVDPQQTHATRFLTPWGNSLHLLSCPHTLCDVYVFDYRLFRMEESQWVRVLFQLKIIIRDLHWGRKSNVWSFSSVSLNMEDVSRPSTSHPCPCPLLCLILPR